MGLRGQGGLGRGQWGGNGIGKQPHRRSCQCQSAHATGAAGSRPPGTGFSVQGPPGSPRKLRLWTRRPRSAHAPAPRAGGGSEQGQQPRRGNGRGAGPSSRGGEFSAACVQRHREWAGVIGWAAGASRAGVSQSEAMWARPAAAAEPWLLLAGPRVRWSLAALAPVGGRMDEPGPGSSGPGDAPPRPRGGGCWPGRRSGRATASATCRPRGSATPA